MRRRVEWVREGLDNVYERVCCTITVVARKKKKGELDCPVALAALLARAVSKHFASSRPAEVGQFRLQENAGAHSYRISSKGKSE